MRLAAISDVHVGNHRRFGGPVVAGMNTRCKQIVNALRLACSTAREERCEALLICGDLFDGVRPEPQVITAVIDALKQGPREVYVIKGNHDSVSDQVGDHALGPLDRHSRLGSVVSVFDKPTRVQGVDAPILLVPFQAGPASGWLPAALDATVKGLDQDEDRAVVALHLGVSDENTAQFLRGVPDSISQDELATLMHQRRIRAAFCGNWHDYGHWAAREDIFQVGALCPTGFDNPGPEYGRMVIWDTEAEVHEELCVPGPRFLKLDVRTLPQSDIELVRALVKDGCSVYLSITTDLDRFPAAEALLTTALEFGAVDGEIALDSGGAEIAARDAAQAARSAGSLEESLAGFVREMQLPEGVSREEVLGLSKRYLKWV